jgi:hypothetical protein
MSQNVSKFRWNKLKSQAAVRVAEGRMTDEEIAAEAHVTRRQLTRWKAHPTFAAKVEQHVRALDDAASRRAITRRLARVEALDDRWRRMRNVIAERADDLTMAGVPGGGTGLVVRSLKSIGGGETAQVVEEYAVDTGLLRELREHEKQAAQELGQWAEKHEHTGKDGAELVVKVIGGQATMDDL